MLPAADDVGYLPRAVDDVLVRRLSSFRALVTVTGPPAAGVSCTVGRAIRQARPDDLLWPVTDPYAVRLGDLVNRARHRATPERSVLVWCDDAPLALLDQVSADLLGAMAGRPPSVRLVLTLRWGLAPLARGVLSDPEFVPLVVPPLGAAELSGPEAATFAAGLGGGRGRSEGPDDAGGAPGERGPRAGTAPAPVTPAALVGRRVGELVARGPAVRAAFDGPTGDVLRLAAVWDRLGVPAALDVDRLVALSPDGPARAEVEGYVRDAVGAGWLTRTRRAGARHLAPARVLVEPARLPSPELVRRLAGLLTLDDRYSTARAAVAAGLDHLAAELVVDLVPDGLTARPALRIARAFATTDRDREAAQWFGFVLAVGDPEQVRAAHRGLGLLFYRYDRLGQARRHLLEVADQLGVQVVLADIALRRGETAEARRLLRTLAGAGDVALAGEAACQLGLLETRAGAREAAQEAYRRALRSPDDDVVARARAGLAALDGAGGPAADPAADGALAAAAAGLDAEGAAEVAAALADVAPQDAAPTNAADEDAGADDDDAAAGHGADDPGHDGAGNGDARDGTLAAPAVMVTLPSRATGVGR